MIKSLAGESNRIVRFIAVGALNTVFGLTVYSVFIWCGSPTWLGLIGGNLAGLAFNFMTTGGLVFADLSRRRIPAFAAVYIGTYLLNLGLIHGLSPIIGGPILSQVMLTPIMAVIAYLLMSRVVFSDRSSANRQNRK